MGRRRVGHDGHRSADTPQARFPDAKVWTLCAALAAATAAAIVGLEPIAARPALLHLPWWLLAMAFAATELCVVHIHIRRSSHSLTLGEIPLVLGLLFASPVELIAAWIVGAGCVLLLRREIPLVRIVFNIALFGVTAGVAGSVFHSSPAPRCSRGRSSGPRRGRGGR